MYPDAADLTSKRVLELLRSGTVLDHQQRDPIRGMPGIGKLEAPDHIWNLVNYVRTLPGNSRKGDSTK
jgi:hypothetical protein